MGNIWVISDTHFGAKNNSKSWESIFNEWMEYIVPFFKNQVKEDDILVHLGDVFDNRQSIGLSTMNLAVSFFEKMSGIFSAVYVLCGNHDAYSDRSNDITSLECLKYIPKVKVIKKPERMTFSGRNIVFIPWCESIKKVKDELDASFSNDIVFCHADFGGCTMNASGTKSKSELETPSDMRIYSGHIHHRQRHGCVTYVGSPYQLTQNDRNNTKGVWLINPESMEDEFFENNVSPQFSRFNYTDIENMSFGDFKKLCKDKFVEVSVDGDLLSRVFFRRLLTYITDDDKIRDLTFVPNSDKTLVAEKRVTMSECVSLDDMLNKYIDDVLACGQDVKENVRKITKKLIHGQ